MKILVKAKKKTFDFSDYLPSQNFMVIQTNEWFLK